MHRIDTSTAQKDKFGQGKNGFTDGDPSTGRQSTDLDADMFDALQEEVCAVIEAANITLKKGELNQLLTALKALFLAEDDSRVSGALQKDKNLSDLTDKAKAKEALSLDKVGNWNAVQANGGLHSSGNHHIYVDWAEDGKLHITVDTSDEGALFTTANPPTAAQTDAVPMNGGTLHEEASLTVISSVKDGAAGQALYGPLFRSCMQGRGGDGDFKDGASVAFRIVEVVSNYAYAEILFDGYSSIRSFQFRNDGSLHVPSSVYAGEAFIAPDGNVYGTMWGGYLSNYIATQIGNVETWANNSFQPKNSADLGSGWEKDNVTGRIRQWGSINYGKVGFYGVNFPIAFPNACANVQVTAINNGSSKFADNCATAGNITQAGFLCGQDGQGAYWEATGW